jgi:hypothetical protein
VNEINTEQLNQFYKETEMLFMDYKPQIKSTNRFIVYEDIAK